MNLQLKRLRKEAGYKSRASFAKALGTNERNIKAWELGETNLSLKQACDCADLLDCSLDELAGRDFSPPAYSDPWQAELNRCYEDSTPDRKRRIVDTARDAALASGDAAERAVDGAEGVSA